MLNYIASLFIEKPFGELNPGKEMGIIGIGILAFVFLFLYFVYAFRKIKDYLKERRSDQKDDDKRE